jgi:hypothetical protein
LAFSYWIDYLGFITEGILAAIFIKPSLGVSNWPVIYFINYTPTSSLALFITAPSTSFLAPLPGKRRLLQGEFSTHILYFVFSFALFYFCLHLFIENTKKLVPSIVVIFVGMLLSCFIMLSINGWLL